MWVRNEGFGPVGRHGVSGKEEENETADGGR